VQSPAQNADQYPWRYKPGQSGNPAGSLSKAAKRARVLARAEELAQEFGGLDKLTPVDRLLVEQAAALSMKEPRAYEHIVRHANSINRLLSAVRAHNGRREAPHPFTQAWDEANS
jgi:hypothetical protein